MKLCEAQLPLFGELSHHVINLFSFFYLFSFLPEDCKEMVGMKERHHGKFVLNKNQLSFHCILFAIVRSKEHHN